jgi:predicted MFS family arabinose efflux permease
VTWRPVAALAATTTTGYGVLFYAYGVLLVPMEQDLGWGRPFLSGALSAALVVAALLSIPVGHWLDRRPARALFTSAAVTAASLLTVWAAAPSRAVFLATWLALGACQAVLFYEPAFAVLTKRFEGRERQRALTVVTLAGGLASTIFAPLTAALEASLGWRGAVGVLAGLLLVVTVPCFAIGLAPADVELEDREESSAPADAFRSRAFVLVTVAYLLTTITTFAVGVHLVAYLRERGLAAATAALALGAVGLVQVLGRTLFAGLSKRWSALEIGTWVLTAKAAGIVMLVVIAGLPGVFAFVVVYGSANGLSTLTRALTVAELYGPRYYGAIAATVSAVGALGGAVAPFLAAAAIEAVGDSEPVLLGLAALSALAAVANELVARPDRRRRFVSRDGVP